MTCLVTIEAVSHDVVIEKIYYVDHANKNFDIADIQSEVIKKGTKKTVTTTEGDYIRVVEGDVIDYCKLDS